VVLASSKLRLYADVEKLADQVHSPTPQHYRAVPPTFQAPQHPQQQQQFNQSYQQNVGALTQSMSATGLNEKQGYYAQPTGVQQSYGQQQQPPAQYQQAQPPAPGEQPQPPKKRFGGGMGSTLAHGAVGCVSRRSAQS
jgi:hypothetical protein